MACADALDGAPCVRGDAPHAEHTAADGTSWLPGWSALAAAHPELPAPQKITAPAVAPADAAATNPV